MALDSHSGMGAGRGRRATAARARGSGRRFVTTVHARGAASLDGMLALTEIASRVAPRDEVLAELVRRTADLLGVDVCSIYLRDDLDRADRRVGGELVL